MLPNQLIGIRDVIGDPRGRENVGGTARSLMRRPVLPRNASYEALRIIPAMRTLKLVIKRKATVELASSKLIYPGALSYLA